MPAPGDQHKPNGATTQNPFEELKPQISNYTAQEIATLQSRLNKRLGPEYISTRAGPGNSRVAYLSAEKAINLANEVFGFNGWSSSIQNIQIDFVDENAAKGTISIGLSVVVRITLRDGTYHEDTGYGGIENCKSKIAAFEKAKKEGTTDALKRALRNFGNVLGNCIYDKEYITKVSKIKAGTGKWDVNDLHRHADFAPKQEEVDVKKPISNIILPQQQLPPTSLVPEESFDVDVNEFDDADFGNLDNPDEVMLPPDSIVRQTIGPQKQQSSKIPPHHQTTPSKPPQHRADHNYNQASNRQAPHLRNNNSNVNTTPNVNEIPQIQNGHPQSRSSSPGLPSQHFAPPPPQAPPGPQSIGFFSAKAADSLDGNNNPTQGAVVVPKFNPHAESPSIRKTSGVDHSKSLALNRTTLKPEPLVPKDEVSSPKPATRPIAANRSMSGTHAIAPGAGAGTGLGTSPAPAARNSGPGNATGSAATGGASRLTSEYRPPTRHGGAPGGNNIPATATANTGERILTAAKRSPLGDLSNVRHDGTADAGGGDVKRQRIGPGLSGHGSGENTMPG